MSVRDPEEGRALMKRVMEQPKKVLFGVDSAIFWSTLAVFTLVPRDGDKGKEEAQAHIYINDVPGTGKTALIRALAAAIDAKSFIFPGRADCLPSDITGGQILNKITGRYFLFKGPIFCNMFLFDEINRAAPKAQAPMLGALEGGFVVINVADPALGIVEAKKFSLYPISDAPDETRIFFMALATANPIESEGTFTLSEAQRERFTFSFRIGYPPREEEKKIRAKVVRGVTIEKVINLGEVLDIAYMILDTVKTPLSVDEYIQRLMENSRPHGVYQDSANGQAYASSRQYADQELNKFIDEYIKMGLSPRRNFHLEAAARTYAFYHGRNVVTVDDVKAVAPVTLPHPFLLHPWAKTSGVTIYEVVRRLVEWTQIV